MAVLVACCCYWCTKAARTVEELEARELEVVRELEGIRGRRGNEEQPSNIGVTHLQQTENAEDIHVHQNASYQDEPESVPSAPPCYDTANIPDDLPPSYDELFNSKSGNT